MEAGWRLFLGMATQWEQASLGMGGSVRTGLKYGSLEPVARSMGLDYPLAPDTFADIRLLESEALAEWSKRRG